ncbi:MAG: MptD family putative ECF transporter S component, partial [Clostridia bacterium]|nr:MptD family putative ECF transporter S component [Clostridia bacterium]
MKQWTRKNSLLLLLYAVLYAITTALVCVTGSFHPILFVCYQITAGLLLSGIVIKAFDTVRAPGAAVCLGLGMLLLLVIIRDAVPWHVLPVIIIAALAEIIRAASKYSWTGDVAGTVVMSFSSFGYYGQIWFNRAYTYECCIEEMPAGYGDVLMSLSPAWALPVVVLSGIILSVIISNVTARCFKSKWVYLIFVGKIIDIGRFLRLYFAHFV